MTIKVTIGNAKKFYGLSCGDVICAEEGKSPLYCTFQGFKWNPIRRESRRFTDIFCLTKNGEEVFDFGEN